MRHERVPSFRCHGAGGGFDVCRSRRNGGGDILFSSNVAVALYDRCRVVNFYFQAPDVGMNLVGWFYLRRQETSSDGGGYNRDVSLVLVVIPLKPRVRAPRGLWPLAASSPSRSWATTIPLQN